MSLRDEFLEGTLWTAVGRYSNKGISFLVTVVLSRILPAKDFGIVAMVVALTAFASLLAEAGIGSTVIQKKEDLDARALSSVFWLSATIGGALALTVFLTAPLVGSLYQDPRVVAVTRVISVKFLLIGVVTVPLALLKRKFRFRPIAAVEVSSAVIAGVIAVALAFTGFGYWALVVQILVNFSCLVVGVGMITDWRPRFSFRLSSVRDVVSYSAFVLGSQSVNYWSRHADDFLVGRYLGASQLGFYEHAYRLMMVPLQVLTYAAQPALHPILVSVKENVERLRKAYLELTEALGLISFPLGAYLAVVASPLVLVIWGPDWGPTVEVFRVLALLAAVQPVVSTAGTIFLVRDRTRLMLGISSINMVALVVAFALGLSHGIVGVATGFGVAYLAVVAPLTVYVVVVVLLEGRVRGVLRALLRPTAAGVAVGLVSKLTYEVVEPQMARVPALLVVTLAAGCTFALYLRWRAWDRLETLARTRVGRRVQKGMGLFRGESQEQNDDLG